MKKLKSLLAAALAALGLCACAGLHTVPEDLQGHWVDINSETALDISGNKMTVTSAGTEETYTVNVKQEGSFRHVVNADGSGAFGFMSEFTEYQDGQLTATEQVLDEAGHRYEFVREEVKAQELEIWDKSTDMPKVIESDEIVYFGLGFSNRGLYGLSDEWPECDYSWNIEADENGILQCDYAELYDECMGRTYEGEVSEAFMKDLAERVQACGAVAYNGYYMGNSSSEAGYTLRVTYASGEELHILAMGGAGKSCVFDLETLLEAMTPLLGES